MLCLNQNGDYTLSEFHELPQTLEILKSLKISKTYKVQLANHFKSYLTTKKTIQEKFKSNSGETAIMTIREMTEKYSSKHLDWLQMINKQLLRDSQKTLDDRILIENLQLLKELHTLFEKLEET